MRTRSTIEDLGGAAGLWLAVALLCLAAPPESVSQPAADTGAVAPGSGGAIFFPAERLFPPLTADGTAGRLSLGKDTRTRRWIGSMGGVQRILQCTIAGRRVQFGAGATVYASLIRQPDVLQVITADFFVDIPVDIELSNSLVLRTGYGHYSAHLADDGIELLRIPSLNYAKDFIPLLVAYRIPGIDGFAYGGGKFDYYTIPARGKHWVGQAGAEAGMVSLPGGLRTYAAFDIKLKSEAAWGSTQSYQLGIRLLEHDSHAIRLAYTYRTGLDDRGQFYLERTTISLVGVYVDY